MIKTTKLLALFGILAFVTISPASASEPGCDCDKKVMEVPVTATRWVDLKTDMMPRLIAECKMFDGMVLGQQTVAVCNGSRIRCFGGPGRIPDLCQALITEPKLRIEVQPEPVVRERVIIREVPEVRERTFIPVTRERTVVRHRHVERERDTGGAWHPISHRSTMNCWGRGSIKRNSYNLRGRPGKAIGMCNGKLTRCKGGSEDNGDHRQCWAKH